MRLLIQLGSRRKVISVVSSDDETFWTVLQRTVREVMSCDPVLQDKADKGFVVTYFNKKYKDRADVDFSTEEDEVDDNQPLVLEFYENMTVDIPTRNNVVIEKTAAELSYLASIGLPVQNMSKAPAPPPPPPAPAAASKQRPTAPTPKRLSTKRPRRIPEPESPLDPYEERVLIQRKENLEFLRNHNIKGQAPKLNKKRRGKQEKTIIRVMPSRAAKLKPSSLQTIEEDEDGDIAAVEEVHQSAAGPVAAEREEQVQRKPVLRWRKRKTNTLFGRTITKYTPLPEFPKEMNENILNGVYSHRHMNTFLKKHVKNVTGRDTPTKSEYGVLSEQVSRRLQSMGVLNTETLKMKIKVKLSASIRATKSYQKNIKPRRKAEKLDKADKNNHSDNVNEEVEKDEADEILRKPVQNKASVKTAIHKSTTRLNFIDSNSVQDVIQTYPYLQHADLLVYEYTTRVPISLEDAESNYLASLAPLAHILEKENPQTELEELLLFKEVEKYFAIDNTVWPSIKFWHSNNSSVQPLSDIPRGQSPAIVVLQNETEIESVSLVFDGETITTDRAPKSFNCLALLMAGYYVFNIEYPKPYLEHLSVFEAILHDDMKKYKVRGAYEHPRRHEFMTLLLTAKGSYQK